MADRAAGGSPAGGSGAEHHSFEAWDLPAGTAPPDSKMTLVLEPSGSRLRWLRWQSDQLRELCGTLRAARSAWLAEAGVDSVVAALGAVGARFLDEKDPLRRRALELLPSYSALSPPMARRVLDGMARDWTEPRLRRLVETEFGDPAVLDRFRPDPRLPAEDLAGPGRMVRAVGPELSYHVCASTVPGVSVTSMIRALLVKSAVALKPGRWDAVLPVLFVGALREEAPQLAACVAVDYRPGGGDQPDDVLIEGADAIVVYGGDEVVRQLRRRTPVTRIFVAYRHRVGAILVGGDGLGSERGEETAERVARAVAAFDQRGCVSPHVVYVELVEGDGDGHRPEAWTDRLADALESLEDALPSGPLLPSEATEIQQIRGAFEMRAAAGERVGVRHGGRAPWTVLLEPDPGFAPSCGGRVVRVRPVSDLGVAVDELAAVGRHLQTVCMEGVGDRRIALAESLARIGAVRITDAVHGPWPPAWWHHDGRGPLESLVRWVDLEG